MKNSLLILFFGLASFLATAQKNVLLEKFTHIHCGQCPNGSLMIQDYQELYSNLIWISHYKQVSFDWSPLTNEESALLWADLNVWGNPTAMFDRTPINGDLINSSNYWGASIDQQSQQSSSVKITFDEIEFDSESRDLSFDVNLLFESVDQMAEYRIIAYAVEDDVEWWQKSYYNNVEGHPLEGLGEIIESYQHQNVIRNIISGRWGTWNGLPEVVEPGITLTKRFTHKIRSDYDETKTKIVVAVTQHHETDFNQRPILNSELFSVKEEVLSSIEDQEDTGLSDFNTYPNPAQNLLTLEFEILPDLIQIVSSQGKVVSTFTPSELKTQLDLTHLTAGVYHLQVILNDQVGVRRLVVE